MSMIIVHGIPGSPYVRTVLLACEEKGAPYRLRSMKFGEPKLPEHLARQPFGRMPTIEHGDFKLYETAAIIRYIDQAFDGAALTAPDIRAHARMTQVMNIVDWYVMPSISRAVVFNRVIAPRFGMPLNESEVSAGLPMAQVCVNALTDLLGEHPYFGGKTISLADLMVFPHLDYFPQSPEGQEMLFGTSLSTWLARMNERASAINTGWDRLLQLESAA